MNITTQILPLLTILASAMILLLLISWWRKIGSELLLVLSIVAISAFIWFSWQGWLNPGGVFQMFIFDRLAFIGYILFAVAGGMALIGAHNYITSRSLPWGEYIALILFALFGGAVMVSGSNLIVIFIGLEILSLSAYVLAGFDRHLSASHEASIKYFILGAVASAITLFGIAFYYGAYGTLQLGVPGLGALQFGTSGLGTLELGTVKPVFGAIAIGLILSGFGFKIAAVPFQWWTPDVYQGSPLPVTTFFATTVKAAAFIAFFRILNLGAADFSLHLNSVIMAIAIATMTFGNLAALFQEDIKRMLAYSSISHAGYMLLAFVIMKGDPVFAKSSLLFYLLGYIVMSAGAFTVLTLKSASRQVGKSTSQSSEHTHISDFAGLGRTSPWLAFAFTVFLLSLMGVPPTAGFFAKFYLFRAVLWQGHTTLVLIAVANSLVSVYYYMRPVVIMYFPDHAGSNLTKETESANYSTIGVIVFATIAVILLGLFPSVILSILELSN